MEALDFILHFDEHLQTLIEQLGAWSYIILFGIIFAETGLVVTPFLPGDSLLFVAGALAAKQMLRLEILVPTLIAAAIIGDTVNYWIGHKLGRRVFDRQNARFFKPEHLEQTQEFYARHGGKTIILARFVPIVRTFAPFVAGVGRMHYPVFLAYNVVGAIIWVVSLTLAGFFFGNIPVVKDNFETAIILVIVVSFIPPAIEFAKHRKRRAAKAEATNYDEIEETFKKEHLND